MFPWLWLCGFQGPRRVEGRGLRPRAVSQNSTACDVVARTRRAPHRPGPVDIPGTQAPSSCRRLSSRPSEAAGRRPVVAPIKELPRKEVIQPQLPLRLPCYDFTPITSPTFDGSLQKVRPPASGVTCFRGVTGGVYKARERIHPSIADLGLLATPPSWRRVSASNPNRDALFGIRSTSRYRSPLYRPM